MPISRLIPTGPVILTGGWTTLISFALQALAVGCLLLLPLLYSEGLPKLVLLAPLPDASPTAGGAARAAAPQSAFTCSEQPDGNEAGDSSRDPA